jgi:hypothetical protein
MSVADRIKKIYLDITNAYKAVENNGGTVPTKKNTENLATAIGTVKENLTPELNLQKQLLDTQKTIIEQIKEALNIKNTGKDFIVSELETMLVSNLEIKKVEEVE